MKFGFRTPSLKKRIAARTSWKRIVRHSMGLKAPRGYGWLTNPKKAAYNRIYSRVTADPIKVAASLMENNAPRRKGRSNPPPNSYADNGFPDNFDDDFENVKPAKRRRSSSNEPPTRWGLVFVLGFWIPAMFMWLFSIWNAVTAPAENTADRAAQVAKEEAAAKLKLLASKEAAEYANKRIQSYDKAASASKPATITFEEAEAQIKAVRAAQGEDVSNYSSNNAATQPSGTQGYGYNQPSGSSYTPPSSYADPATSYTYTSPPSYAYSNTEDIYTPSRRPGKDIAVRGYYNKHGTYVAPHTRSAPHRHR